MAPRSRLIIGIGGLVVAALAITAAYGWHGGVIFLFVAALPVALAVGLAVGGGWIQDWSRSRFDDHDRHGPRRRD